MTDINSSKPSDSDPYDSAFRTILNDAPLLVIPMVNEIFGETYSHKARVIFAPNEHFLNGQDGTFTKRVTDSSFTVEENGIKKHYLWECESKATNAKILFRIFEYSSQIGLDQESEPAYSTTKSSSMR